jgi:hypothetical protein
MIIPVKCLQADAKALTRVEFVQLGLSEAIAKQWRGSGRMTGYPAVTS